VRRFARGALAALVAGSLVAFPAYRIQAQTEAPSPAPAPSVSIAKCLVQTEFYSGALAELIVRFQNDGSERLKSITLRAKYGNGWIDFTEIGDFAPGVPVTRTSYRTDKTFPAGEQLSQEYYRSGPANCTVVATETATGVQWRDATLPAATENLPPRPKDDATPLPATIDKPTGDPIGVVGCQLELQRLPFGRKGVAILKVRFHNLSTKPMNKVEFRAFYGSAGYDFTYLGTFAPGILLNSFKHNAVFNRALVDRNLDVPWRYTSLDAASECIPLGARYADGTQWTNPNAGPTPPPLAPEDAQ
jgi:hypothetical protein